MLAAELGVDTMDVARVGLGGQPLDRMSTATPANPEPAALVDMIVDMMRLMLKSASDDARLVGIGLAVPGVVTDSSGLVRFAPNLGWSDVGLTSLLQHRIGTRVSIHIGNDAELGASGRAHPWRRSGDEPPHLPVLRCRSRRWRHRRRRADDGRERVRRRDRSPAVQPQGTDLPVRQRGVLGDGDRVARGRRGRWLPHDRDAPAAGLPPAGRAAAGRTARPGPRAGPWAWVHS